MLLLNFLQKPVNLIIIEQPFCFIYFGEQALEFISHGLLLDFSIFFVCFFFLIEILLHILPKCRSLRGIEFFDILVKP